MVVGADNRVQQVAGPDRRARRRLCGAGPGAARRSAGPAAAPPRFRAAGRCGQPDRRHDATDGGALMAELQAFHLGRSGTRFPVAVLFIAAGDRRADLLRRPADQAASRTSNSRSVAVTVTQNGAAPGRDGDPDHPAGRGRPGRASPACATSSPTVTQGVSTTRSQFEIGEDLQKVDRRGRASGSTRRAPSCRARSTRRPSSGWRSIASPILTYAVVRAGHVGRRPLLVRRRHRLARAAGARRASRRSRRVGGVDREINVIVDPDRLAAQGLTAAAGQQRAARLRHRRAGRPGRRRRPRADPAGAGRGQDASSSCAT